MLLSELIVVIRGDDADAQAAFARTREGTRTVSDGTVQYTNVVAQLNRQLALAGTTSQKVAAAYETENGALRALSSERKSVIVALAAEVDAKKALIKASEQAAAAELKAARDAETASARAAAAAERNTKAAISTIETKGRQVGRELTSYLTIPIVGIGIAATKVGMDFETAMAKIQSYTGASAGEVKMLREEVLKLGPELAMSPKALAEGLYYIESAGFHGQEALEILRASAKASAAGLGEFKDVAFAATAAVYSFGKSAGSIQDITDLIAKAAALSHAEPNALFKNMGQAIPIAAALGIQLKDVAAGTAIMTREGLSAAKGWQRMTAMMDAMSRPTKQMKDALSSLGDDTLKNFGQVRKSLQEDFFGTIQKIANDAGGNIEKIRAIFGARRAGDPVLAFLNPNAIEENVKLIKDLGNAAGTTDKAFANFSKTFKFEWDQMKAELEVAGIKINDVTRALAHDLVGAIKDVAKWIADLNPKQHETLKEWIKWGIILAAAGPVITGVSGLISLLRIMKGVADIAKLALVGVADAELLVGENGAKATAGGGAVGFMRKYLPGGILGAVGGGSATAGGLVLGGVALTGLAAYSAYESAQKNREYNDQMRAAQHWQNTHPTRWATAPSLDKFMNPFGSSAAAPETEYQKLTRTLKAKQATDASSLFSMAGLGANGLPGDQPEFAPFNPLKGQIVPHLRRTPIDVSGDYTPKGRGSKGKESDAEKEHDAMLESYTQKIKGYATAQRLAGNETEYAAVKDEILHGEFVKLTAAQKEHLLVMAKGNDLLKAHIEAANTEKELRKEQASTLEKENAELRALTATREVDRLSLDEFHKTFAELTDAKNRAYIQEKARISDARRDTQVRVDGLVELKSEFAETADWLQKLIDKYKSAQAVMAEWRADIARNAGSLFGGINKEIAGHDLHAAGKGEDEAARTAAFYEKNGDKIAKFVSEAHDAEQAWQEVDLAMVALFRSEDVDKWSTKYHEAVKAIDADTKKLIETTLHLSKEQKVANIEFQDAAHTIREMSHADAEAVEKAKEHLSVMRKIADLANAATKGFGDFLGGLMNPDRQAAISDLQTELQLRQQIFAEQGRFNQMNLDRQRLGLGAIGGDDYATQLNQQLSQVENRIAEHKRTVLNIFRDLYSSLVGELRKTMQQMAQEFLQSQFKSLVTKLIGGLFSKGGGSGLGTGAGGVAGGGMGGIDPFGGDTPQSAATGGLTLPPSISLSLPVGAAPLVLSAPMAMMTGASGGQSGGGTTIIVNQQIIAPTPGAYHEHADHTMSVALAAARSKSERLRR